MKRLHPERLELCADLAWGERFMHMTLCTHFVGHFQRCRAGHFPESFPVEKWPCVACRPEDRDSTAKFRFAAVAPEVCDGPPS
jgi:hypothetical protein